MVDSTRMNSYIVNTVKEGGMNKIAAGRRKAWTRQTKKQVLATKKFK